MATPALFSNNSSKFKCGSEVPSLLRYDNEDNSIILFYPISLSANNGNKPIVSSNLKLI